jgi:hypothetical protein
MTPIPKEIHEAVAARRVEGVTKPGMPVHYTWVFDPRTAEVHVSDDHAKERRHKTHHNELAEQAGHHPARVHGYAYRIRGGWRLTDWDHKAVDRFVGKKVVEALNEKERDAEGSSQGSEDARRSDS